LGLKTKLSLPWLPIRFWMPLNVALAPESVKLPASSAVRWTVTPLVWPAKLRALVPPPPVMLPDSLPAGPK